MTPLARQSIRRAVQQRVLRDIGDIPPEPPPDPVAALEAAAYQRAADRVALLLPPRKQRQGVPVRCVETGKVYESISAAARKLRTTYFAVYQSCAFGYRCKGKRLCWA